MQKWWRVTNQFDREHEQDVFVMLIDLQAAPFLIVAINNNYNAVSTTERTQIHDN